MMRISKARRGLVGIFLACLMLLIGYLGESHGHEAGHAHHECDICQVSAQPFMGEEPPAHTAPPALHLVAPEASKATASLRRHQPFSSRAPPAS